jgi:hypothetical protein
MPPVEPTDEERLEELSQDNQTPFQPADPVADDSNSDLPADHPATDSNMQPEELYEEGIAGAAEVEDTSSQSAVTDYNPDAVDEPTDEDDQTL